MSLTSRVKSVDDKFGAIPIYTECNKYFFESITTIAYINAINPNKDEVNCYCRYLGKSTVEKDTGDAKTLCQDWLNSFDNYYYSMARLIMIMLFLNVFITYFFKLAFNPKIF